MPPRFSELRLEFIQTSLDDDGIAVFKLDRPPSNAHHLAMIEELDQVALAVRFDPDVRVAVMGSTSDRFFSAGADITVLRDEDPVQIGLLSQFSKETIMRMRATPKLYLAAVAGHCMGGGLELALACDLRFAADGNYQFGVPEVALGLIPGEGGTQLLGRHLTLSQALELMVTGRPFTPKEAKELGLVDRLVPQDELWETVMDFARRVANGPQRAIGATKIALTEGLESHLWAAFAFERELQNQLFDTPDAKEGVSAFFEKREPDFTKSRRR